SLAVLHAIEPGGGSVQEPQRRSGAASDLSSTRTPDRGAHFREFPGLLRAGEFARESAPAGAGPERAQCAGKIWRDANARRAFSDDRRPRTGLPPLYTTGGRPETIAGPVEIDLARTTSAAPEREARIGN